MSFPPIALLLPTAHFCLFLFKKPLQTCYSTEHIFERSEKLANNLLHLVSGTDCGSTPYGPTTLKPL